jgi:outer membrane receptor protein involved in Fe transport
MSASATLAEAQSHGVELEATGSLTRQLRVDGVYAWCDAGITRDSLGFVGRTLPDPVHAGGRAHPAVPPLALRAGPHHKANVCLRYAFAGGMLIRLALSGGLVYVGDRFTASDNVTIAAAYTRADATAAYALRSRG